MAAYEICFNLAGLTLGTTLLLSAVFLWKGAQEGKFGTAVIATALTILSGMILTATAFCIKKTIKSYRERKNLADSPGEYTPILN